MGPDSAWMRRRTRGAQWPIARTARSCTPKSGRDRQQRDRRRSRPGKSPLFYKLDRTTFAQAGPALGRARPQEADRM